METAFAELPLAVFTTLAPIGAGAYLALFAAFLKCDFDDAQLKAIDRWTLLPLLLVIVGLAASALHVANPAHGIGVFAGIGHSPLSNEVTVGILFTVVALVYSIVGLAGKLGGARKGFSLVVALLGIVLTLFTGLAYMVPTIGSWDTPLLPLEMVAFALAGGAAVAACILAGAGALGKNARKPLVVLAVVGAALAIVCEIVRLAMVTGSGNALVNGQVLVGGVAGVAVAGLVLVAASCLVLVVSLRGKGTKVAGISCGLVAIVVGVFLVRLAFYGTYLSVGLALL